MKLRYVVPLAAAALVTAPAFAATPSKTSVHQAAATKTVETVKTTKTAKHAHPHQHAAKAKTPA